MIGGMQSSMIDQELELCKALQKLLFQLLQLTNKLHEMIKSLMESPSTKECDISDKVLLLHRALLHAVHELTQETIANPSTRSIDLTVDSMVQLLTGKQFKAALIALRCLRSQLGSELGCCEQVDVEVLLLAFCRAQVNQRVWAVVGSEAELFAAAGQLRQTNVQLASMVRALNSDCNTSTRSSRFPSSDMFRPL